MHLSGLHVTNITCFDDILLDFTNETPGTPAPWVVLLGENGTGKSTILQMIGAALLGYNQFVTIATNVDWRGYIRYGSLDVQSSRSWVWIQSEPGDKGYASRQQAAETYFVFRKATDSPSEKPIHPTPDPRIHDTLLDTLYSESLTGGWFACGYSSWRPLATRKGSGGDSGIVPTLEESAKPFRFASLFGDGSRLTNIPDWLAGLYFRAIYPGHTEADERRFEAASKALLRALPRIDSLEVTQDRQVIAIEAKSRVPLERLSDGYKGMAAWVGDLIRRLFDAFPESKDPLRERGVVLVDEIDMHLHPRWQRSVVEDIRHLFPNLQFIVTTHSPFVAQDMRHSDKIIVLERSKRKGSPVAAREAQGNIYDWNANQILGGYFGLSGGTRGEEIEKKETRYRKLLQSDATESLTGQEQMELEQLRLTMSMVPRGDTNSERIFEDVADSVVASLRNRRKALESQRQAYLAEQAEGSTENQAKDDADVPISKESVESTVR